MLTPPSKWGVMHYRVLTLFEIEIIWIWILVKETIGCWWETLQPKDPIPISSHFCTKRFKLTIYFRLLLSNMDRRERRVGSSCMVTCFQTLYRSTQHNTSPTQQTYKLQLS